MIAFQDESTSIIDSWMAGESLPKEEEKAKKTSSSAVPEISSDNRLGLGFTAQPSSSSATNKSNDALQKALKKAEDAKARKRKAEEMKDLHGVVEDDLHEESRTAVGSSLTNKKIAAQTAASAVSNAAPNKQPHNAPRKKPKQTDTNKPNNNNNNNNKNNKQNHDKPSHPAPTATTTTPAETLQATTPAFASTSAAAAHAAQEGEKPKRKKTRSKQKNIRRDNRAESDKPAHLLVGSKQYAGRPLTAETKALLGIDSSKSKSALKKQKQKEKAERRKERENTAQE